MEVTGVEDRQSRGRDVGGKTSSAYESGGAAYGYYSCASVSCTMTTEHNSPRKLQKPEQ